MMKVQARKSGDVSILDCSGEVDLHSSTRLREALVKQTDDHVPALLVNLTDVNYIDSSGIAVLLQALWLSQNAQTRLALFYGLRTNALLVLKLARLETVFAIFETEQEAVEKIFSTQLLGGVLRREKVAPAKPPGMVRSFLNRVCHD